jgi:hypothetical protein
MLVPVKAMMLLWAGLISKPAKLVKGKVMPEKIKIG